MCRAIETIARGVRPVDPLGPGDPGADWNRSVPREPIVELFRDWTFDWLDVPGIIAASDELLEYPMVDLDPVERVEQRREPVAVGDGSIGDGRREALRSEMSALAAPLALVGRPRPSPL